MSGKPRPPHTYRANGGRGGADKWHPEIKVKYRPIQPRGWDWRRGGAAERIKAKSMLIRLPHTNAETY